VPVSIVAASQVPQRIEPDVRLTRLGKDGILRDVLDPHPGPVAPVVEQHGCARLVRTISSSDGGDHGWANLIAEQALQANNTTGEARHGQTSIGGGVSASCSLNGPIGEVGFEVI